MIRKDLLDSTVLLKKENQIIIGVQMKYHDFIDDVTAKKIKGKIWVKSKEKEIMDE